MHQGTQDGFMAKRLLVLLLAALVLAACGGGGNDSDATSAQPSSPVVEETPYEAPKPDTVPLEKAKKGELIALPFYPDVGKYGGTADVRGMKTFEMKMPLINNSRMFGPSVLIGSPGQEITLTGFDAENPGRDVSARHDFRISDTEAYSSEHEIAGKLWHEHKGTKFTITFPDEGEVAFYCKYHLRINMAGMLIVRD